MSLHRWIIPIAVGTAAGWLAGLAQSAYFPPGPRMAATPARIPPGAAQASLPVPLQVSSGKADALQLADQALADAETLLARIMDAGPAELPGLWEAMKKLPFRSIEQRLAEAAIFQRWIEVGPVEGIAWLTSSGNTSEIEKFVGRWIRTDAPAATAWLEAHPDPNQMADLWAAWSGSDDELKQYAEAFTSRPALGGGLKNIARSMVRLAENDPAWAIAFFEKLPPESQQLADVAEAIARGMSYQDVGKAFDWAKSLPEGKTRDKALASALCWGAANHPEQVAELLKTVNLPDDDLANSRGRVASALGDKSPQAMRDFLRSLPDGCLAESWFTHHINNPSDQSLAGLQETLTELTRTGMKDTRISIQWQNRDSAKDAASLAALPDGPAKTVMLDRWAQAAQLGPDYRKTEVVAALPESIRGSVAAKLLPIAFQQGDQATVRTYWGFLSEPERTALLSQGVPTADVPFMQSLIATLPRGQQGAPSVGLAKSWALDDPAAASNWAAQLPPGDQPGAFAGIAESYAASDESAAARWVESMSSGPVRDAAASGLVTTLAANDPDSALIWAKSIADEPRRHQALETLARSWVASDSESAAGAAATAAFSTRGDSAAFAKGLSNSSAP
jgi:hypothetical protein